MVRPTADTLSHRKRAALLVLLILTAGPGAAAPANAAEAQSGLWFGPVHLCRDTVAEAVAGIEEYSGQPTLTLTLASGLQPRLQRATARKVRRTIKIRLDGRVVQETRVREAITGTSLRLAGFSREETEQSRRRRSARAARARLALLAVAASGCAAGLPPPPASAVAATVSLGQRARIGVVVVTPLRIEEDSRCPTGVQCIQAGTVRVAVRIAKSGARREAVADLGQSIGLNRPAGFVRGNSYPPVRAESRPDDYGFSFAVDRGAEAPACAEEVGG